MGNTTDEVSLWAATWEASWGAPLGGQSTAKEIDLPIPAPVDPTETTMLWNQGCGITLV